MAQKDGNQIGLRPNRSKAQERVGKQNAVIEMKIKAKI